MLQACGAPFRRMDVTFRVATPSKYPALVHGVQQYIRVLITLFYTHPCETLGVLSP